MRTTALLSVLVGAVGGYAVARYLDAEPALAAGALWWLLTALAVSVAARRADTTTAIVSVFLLLWIGVPVVAAGVAVGVRDRAAAALDDVFDDFGDTGNDAYDECLVDPETTFEECEALR